MTGYSRPMTPEWEAQIIADLMSGMWVTDVASKHHIGKRRVMAIRDEHDLKNKIPQKANSKHQKMTPEREALIVIDLKLGMSIRNIMRKYVLSYHAVAEVQEKHNLFRRKGRKSICDELEYYEKFSEMWDEARMRVIEKCKPEKPKVNWLAAEMKRIRDEKERTAGQGKWMAF